MGRKLGRGLDVLIGKPEPAEEQLRRRSEVLAGAPAAPAEELPAREEPPAEEPAVEVREPETVEREAPTEPELESEPEASEGLGQQVLELEPESIEANPEQPRREFAPGELEALKASIAREGVLQPIVVRKVDERFQLVAGERRLRACRELGLPSVPALLMAAADERMLELALVENIQRENLNPLEVAVAFRRMLEKQGITQEELAQALGISRSKVGNLVRLLDLPKGMRDAVAQGRITLGHAKILLSVTEPGQREQLFEKIAEDNLSVRGLENERDSLEEELERDARRQRPRRPGKAPRSPQIISLEEQLGERLGTRVRIVEGRGKGRVVIEFYSAEDFDRLREILLD